MKALIYVLISFLVFLSLSCQNDNSVDPKEKASIKTNKISVGGSQDGSGNCSTKKFFISYELTACEYPWSKSKSYCSDNYDLYEAEYCWDDFYLPDEYDGNYNLNLYFRWQGCDVAGQGWGNSQPIRAICNIYFIDYDGGEKVLFKDWIVKPYASVGGEISHEFSPLVVPVPANFRHGTQYFIELSWEARY